MGTRSTYEPVQTRRSNLSFALGACVGIILMFLLTVTGALVIQQLDPVQDVREGDRVCVAMLSEGGEPIPDAYYCGPLVLTEHDEIDS